MPGSRAIPVSSSSHHWLLECREMPKFDHLSEIERIAIVRYVLTAGDDFTLNDSTTELSHVLADPTTLRDVDGLPGNAAPWGLWRPSTWQRVPSSGRCRSASTCRSRVWASAPRASVARW